MKGINTEEDINTCTNTHISSFMNALYMTELSKHHLRSNSQMLDRQA